MHKYLFEYVFKSKRLRKYKCRLDGKNYSYPRYKRDHTFKPKYMVRSLRLVEPTLRKRKKFVSYYIPAKQELYNYDCGYSICGSWRD